MGLAARVDWRGRRMATGSDENRQDEAFNGLIITLNKIPGVLKVSAPR